MMKTSIGAIGAVTFLLLTLVIYLAIKGRLGTYIALATTPSNPQPAQNKNAPAAQTPTPQKSSSPALPTIVAPTSISDMSAMLDNFAGNITKVTLPN